MNPASLTPTARRWAALVAAFERSGLSLRAFAAEHDVNHSTLAWWRARFRSVADAPRFQEIAVVTPQPPPAVPLRVELTGGRVVVEVPAGADLAHLRAVVVALS